MLAGRIVARIIVLDKAVQGVVGIKSKQGIIYATLEFNNIHFHAASLAVAGRTAPSVSG
jgi:hypothetical protein